MTNRPDIYLYLDFREFARDMYAYRKETERGFSFRRFSQRAGLKAPNALQRVMDGEYGLPEETAQKFAQGFKLSRSETHYFVHLAAWNQCESGKQKDFHHRKLLLARRRRQAAGTQPDQYEYLSQWHYVAIRELLQIPQAPSSAAEIAQSLYPGISEEEAQHALETLVRLGLLQKTEGGYTATDGVIDTPAISAAPAIRNFNYQSLNLALDAMEDLDVHERSYGTFTAAVTQEQKQWLFQQLHHIQVELLQKIRKHNKQADQVIHVGSYAIPMSFKKESTDEDT